jgi:hypothetical protein
LQGQGGFDAYLYMSVCVCVHLERRKVERWKGENGNVRIVIRQERGQGARELETFIMYWAVSHQHILGSGKHQHCE